MRHFLKSIFAFIIIALAAACQNEPPHEPVKPKPFAFENKHIKHTELNLDIVPEDKDVEYVVMFAEKKHFVANGIDTRDELISAIEDEYPDLTVDIYESGLEVYDYLVAIE